VVGNDEVHRIIAEQMHSFVRRGGTQDGVPGVFQDELAEVQTRLFIVNSKNQRQRHTSAQVSMPPLFSGMPSFDIQKFLTQNARSNARQAEKLFVRTYFTSPVIL